MPVDRKVDRHAVDGEEHIGGMVGREAADHGIRGEARPLALLVHLDAAGPAEQIIGVRRERPAELRRRDVDRGDRRRAARGRSAVTLMVSSRVTSVLSVRVAAVSTDCASAVPATRASAARALRARIVVCSPARPRGGGRRQVLLSWSRRAGRMPVGGSQTMGAGGACANGSACGVGVAGMSADGRKPGAACSANTCSPPRGVGTGAFRWAQQTWTTQA